MSHSKIPKFNLNDKEIDRIVVKLDDPSQWIERRVESLTFLDDGSTRRRISFDYVVQPEFTSLGYVPLAIFRKGNLLNLDVRSAEDSALSILTTFETADLATRILRSGVKKGQNERLDKLIDEILTFQPSESDQEILKREQTLFSDYLSFLDSDALKTYLTLPPMFLRSFILWVKLPKDVVPYERLITKVSYEETLPFIGTFPPLPVKTIVHPNWSSRFHFEVTVPTELKVSSMTVGSWVDSESEDFPPDPPANTLPSQSKEDFFVYKEISRGPYQVAHVAMDGFPDLPPMYVIIQIIPSFGGVTKIAAFATTSTMLVYSIPTICKLIGLGLIDAPKDGTAAALLLLGPALLVAYLARAPEHPIVAHRLRGARLSLLASGGLLMSAAALLGGVVGEDKLRISWYVLTGISALAWAGFYCWRSMLKILFLEAKFMLDVFKKV